MLKIGFGKGIKPRAFDYKPRFYDPVKEELQERIKKYRDTETESDNIENLKDRIRTGIRLKYRSNPSASSVYNNKSNIRLLIILLVLGFLCYILLSSNKIIGLIEAFSR